MKRIVLIIALLLVAAIPAVAQKPDGHDHSKMMDKAEGEMNCADMMKMHDEMKQKMEKMDTRLMMLVKEMNGARGSAKTEKMADVINELVDQRHAMRDGMMKMQPMMMRHMMGHMQSGMMKGMSEGMAGCPMMGEAADADQTGHEEHN